MKLTALILAGGFGTRLRPAIDDRPKVLAPVNGRPFLSYLLDQLIEAGIGQAILCTGYKGDQIRDTYGERYEELSIQYSQEPEPLGTGGALRHALSLVTTDTVLVMNGDSYIDADLGAYLKWYFELDRDAGLLLTRISDTSPYGKVEADKKGLVLRFEEKLAASGPGLINAGVYILKTSLLATIPSGEAYSMEKDWFPMLAKEQRLYGHVCDGKLIDIGTPESYAQAKESFSGTDR